MNDNNATGVLWKRLRNFLSPQLDLYAHLANHLADKDVLEVGFGTGFGTLQLTKLANSVDAWEVDRDAVKFARKVFPKGVIWLEADITASYQIPKQYDAVVCVETLEHIPDVDAALKNIVLRLRQGGVAYITSPNANADLRKTDLHEREWTAKEFLTEMSKHFDKVELYDYSLTKPQGENSTITPLVAVCKNG